MASTDARRSLLYWEAMSKASAAHRAVFAPFPVFALLVAAWIGPFASLFPQTAQAAQFLATFTDGSRISGSSISAWHKTGAQPKLDGKPLFPPERKLRWLANRELADAEPARLGPRIELASGDRLPGRVVEFVAGSTKPWASAPAHLIVHARGLEDPGSSERSRRVRVLIDFVQRVVWRGAQRPWRPRTVFLRSGGEIAYRRLRWLDGSLQLLTADGVQTISFEDAAEVHLAPPDHWQTYYRTLAMLCPDLSGRMVSLENRDGVVATGSTRTFQASARGAEDDWNHWYHMVQPAWSLDPIWLRFAGIRRWRYFEPEEVPLSSLQPDRVEKTTWLGKGWQWRRDRSTAGESLASGGKHFAWGFGVHATSRLWFSLPPCVSGFRCSVGLDATVGDGGCVRAAVYRDDMERRPLFRSKHLVGSKQVVDTGELPLWLKQPARSLILVADAAAVEAPAGADPLDIRDRVNWLEPLLLLDRDRLQDVVQEWIPRGLPGWQAWRIELADGARMAVKIASQRPVGADGADAQSVGPYSIELSGGAGVFRRSGPLSDEDRLLLIEAQAPEPSDADFLEVRIGEQLVSRLRVERWCRGEPVLVPLAQLERRDADLQVRWLPGNKERAVLIERLAVIDRYTKTRWQPLEAVSVASSGGTKLHLLRDDSLLAAGENPEEEIYTVAGRTNLDGITAFRLEVLPHASLPAGGPGRGEHGKFVLHQFDVGMVPRDQPRQRGRYVRIELAGEDKILSLAEVEVYRGAVNLARLGKASQSSTDDRSAAELAIDGRAGGDVAGGARIATTGMQNDPWWELDLRTQRDIERIVVWNRTDGGFENRLQSFTVTILDRDRREVWSTRVEEPPQPKVELLRPPPEPVKLLSAVADAAQKEHPADYLLTGPKSSKYGWSVGRGNGRPHVVVFRTARPLPGSELLFVFKLGHYSEKTRDGLAPTLGRFRLSATGDTPPIPAERIAPVVPPGSLD